MGYRIIYGPEPVIPQRGSTVRVRVLIGISFLTFAWVVRLLWPEGRELLAQHLLPGDPTLSQAAFSDLLANLRRGLGMVDSLTVFCREILHEIV